MPNRHASGFTLIELMVVVAVVAILATIAYPSYQAQMRKSRRAEAISALQDLQLRQERWRVDHAQFATAAQLGTSPAASRYTISIDTPTSTYYKLIATPTGSQANDSCGTLTLESTNGVVSKKAKNAVNSACW